MAMMTIGGRAYDGIDVKLNADGTRMSVSMRMSVAMGIDDVRTVFREFERMSHGTLKFRVINAPNYEVADLYDDDWRRKPQYEPPILMTNLSGKREYVVYDTLGFWNPGDARRFEEHKDFTPYLCTVYALDENGNSEYDDESVKYSDVFAKSSFDSFASDFNQNEDIGVYVVEELNSRLCMPLTEHSHVLWKYDNNGWEVVNRISVESFAVVQREALRKAVVNGDACARELPQGHTSEDVARREQYRESCLDAEIARDENLLTRALGGADLHEEFEALAQQTQPLVEPK